MTADAESMCVLTVQVKGLSVRELNVATVPDSLCSKH